jgi:CheY-like chemotaxis protein
MARILVVEDDPDARDMMSRALSKAGHNVEAASNGRDALAAISRDKSQLIVLDVRMPVMDGVTFMQVLRSYLRWHDLPVIVVTAITDSTELERVMKYDVAEVFEKANFQLTDFLTRVNEIVPPA